MNEIADRIDERPSPLVRWGFDLPGLSAAPRAWRFVLATVTAVLLSLAACAALVAVGLRMFPATAGYEHYQFGDYSKLTVIGVVIASFGWPAACAVSSRPRRLYLVAAVLVSIVALAPDAWILYQGQPAEGVLVLVSMHVALAVITYLAQLVIAGRRQPSTKVASGLSTSTM